MRTILSIHEIVGVCTHEGREWEICATADAAYAEEDSSLVVQLKSFLRPVSPGMKECTSPPQWLPQDRVRESVSREEVDEVSRQIFRSWTKRVRAASQQRESVRDRSD